MLLAVDRDLTPNDVVDLTSYRFWFHRNFMMGQFSRKLDEVRASLTIEGRWTESRTITQVIFPILRVIGWTPEDHNQIEEKRQIHVGTSDREADIVLKNSLGDALIIEAKAKNKTLNNDDIVQLNSYCSIESIDYGVLTNGRNWYLIDCTEKNPVRVEEINIDSDEDSKIERVLQDFLAFDTVETGEYLQNFAARSRTKKLESAWVNFVDGGNYGSLVKEFIKSTELKNNVKEREFVKAFLKQKLQSINSTADNQKFSTTDPKSSVAIKDTSKKDQLVSRQIALPTTCKIFGNTVEVQSWRDILIKFVEAIGSRNSSDLEFLLNMENHWLIQQVDKRVNYQYRQIGNADIWLNVSLSRKDVLRRCTLIRKTLSINENDLIY